MTAEERAVKKRAKEEARARRQEAHLRSHVVTCPECGKEVLDHMTKCPHCGGVLVPAGHVPMDAEKKRKVRNICYLVGGVIAVVIVICILIFQ